MIDTALFVIAVAALAFTLLPFVWQGRRRAAVNLGAEDLFIAKERIYANIKDLDFDHQVGKIEDDDYHAMRDHLKQDAAAVIERIDHLHDGRATPAAARAPHRSAAAQTCGQCGGAIAAGTRFCPACGQATH